MKEINLIVFGLILDMYGVFWLSKAIIWRSKRQIELETATFFNSNPYLKQVQVEAKYYGWFGFTFLILGFLGQIFGQIVAITMKLNTVLVIIALLLIVGLIFNRLARKHINKNIPKEFREKHGDY